jgi:deoxycytidine triphosphate deaminase
MSTLISGESLRKLLTDPNPVIEGGCDSNVEGIKYDFRLSNQVLLPSFRRAVNLADLPPIEQARIRIEPGETAFVMTEEILHLPIDIKAELSHKRKLAHEGIMTLGGFCIDPMYEGRLIFGLFNFSSRPFSLVPGKKLIAAQFYRLDEDERPKTDAKPQPIYEFPKELENLIDAFRASSVLSLEAQLKDLAASFDTLRKDFDSHQDWFRRFESGIDSLKGLLDHEVQERKLGQDTLTKVVNDSQQLLRVHFDEDTTIHLKHDVYIKIACWGVGILVAAIVAAFIALLVMK